MFLVFGDNRVGQLGISLGNDYGQQPICVNHLEASSVVKVDMNQNQTFIVMKSGMLLTSGQNDNNELARTGKRSYFQRVDAIETFQIKDASLGEGFFHLVCDNGDLLSWGRNELGQLCNGGRENSERPRVNVSIKERLLQIASGSTHTVGLTKSGKIVTWGGNRKGQLGDGQLTSSTTPVIPIQLRHRPIIAIACGENHTLVMTIGGNVYSWGEGTQGQLGLGDTTTRLRPEQITALKSSGARKISAGRNHSLVITFTGLLMAFGSNSHGQCGLDSTEVKIITRPIVVERLLEWYNVDVSGGLAHSLVLCTAKEHLEHQSNASNKIDVPVIYRVYVMGLNSSGQVTCLQVDAI